MPANPPPTGHSTTATVCQGEALPSKADRRRGKGPRRLDGVRGRLRVPSAAAQVVGVRCRAGQAQGDDRSPVRPARGRRPLDGGHLPAEGAARGGQQVGPVDGRHQCGRVARRAVCSAAGAPAAGASAAGAEAPVSSVSTSYGQRFPAGEQRHERGLPGHGGRLVREQEVAGARSMRSAVAASGARRMASARRRCSRLRASSPVSSGWASASSTSRCSSASRCRRHDGLVGFQGQAQQVQRTRPFGRVEVAGQAQDRRLVEGVEATGGGPQQVAVGDEHRDLLLGARRRGPGVA